MNERLEKNNQETGRVGEIVHEAFERQAERTPNATAIVFQGEQTDYRELNDRSNRLAHALLDCGLLPNQPVAIMLADGPNQIVSLFAVI